MAARTYDALSLLARRADALEGARGGLPALFALTDPDRTPDLSALAERLPAGCGLILRTFGEPQIEAHAYTLADIARARGLMLLISADPGLARRCGADGVHWPGWARPFRPWPGAAVTASVHDPGGLRRADRAADAALISTVFTSQSPSARRPMGPFRLAAWARRARVPVYGLGGVDASTVRRLHGLGVCGVAAVGAAGG